LSDRPGLYERALEAAVAIREVVGDVPTIAIILGSGLAGIADLLAGPIEIPYARIPYFPEPTVIGHHGSMLIGAIVPVRSLILQGRFHGYEGLDSEVVTFPVRVLQLLGIRTLILTAATGGIRSDLKPGDLVALSDHLNLTGLNPLRGPNDDRLGPRFPDLTEVYSARLRAIAIEEANSIGFPLSTGVYACMPGPSYETPAEVRMLRTLGADVVGMSTVPEAITARHAGMDVLALALVSNHAAGIADRPINHEEVIAAGSAAVPRLGELIERVVRRLAGEEKS
jgi:purine-nucleoside phosphorylase